MADSSSALFKAPEVAGYDDVPLKVDEGLFMILQEVIEERLEDEGIEL
jgi:hypothetical protein